jgi:hypothetical protein
VEEAREVDDEEDSSSHSPSPPSSAYQQAELGAKQKGWSGRAGRGSRPYSRDSSTDSSQATECQQRLAPYTPCKDADYSSLERDISSK